MDVVALSGGKDSTAMALELAAREPRDYVYLITPTKNEPPEADAHWAKLECLLGKPLVRVTTVGLVELIQIQNCLPIGCASRARLSSPSTQSTGWVVRRRAHIGTFRSRTSVSLTGRFARY